MIPEQWLYDRWNSPIIDGNIVIRSDVKFVINLYSLNINHELFYRKDKDGSLVRSRHGIILDLLLGG